MLFIVFLSFIATSHDRIPDQLMDERALFIAVAQESHNLFVFVREFCWLAAASSLGRRDPDNFIPDQGYFTPPDQPPRHQRIKMEGNRHPVSGECRAPVQNTARPRAWITTIDRGVFVCAPRRWKATHRRDASARAWGKKGRADPRPGRRASGWVWPGVRACDICGQGKCD